MSPAAGKAGKVGDTASRFGSRLVEAAQHRLDLLGIEFGEELERVLGLVLGTAITVSSLFVGFMCLNVLLALLFWEQRVLVFSVLTGVYLGGAVVLALVMWSRVRNGAPPFAATIEELRQDAASLRGSDAS